MILQENARKLGVATPEILHNGLPLAIGSANSLRYLWTVFSIESANS